MADNESRRPAIFDPRGNEFDSTGRPYHEMLSTDEAKWLEFVVFCLNDPEHGDLLATDASCPDGEVETMAQTVAPYVPKTKLQLYIEAQKAKYKSA